MIRLLLASVTLVSGACIDGNETSPFIPRPGEQPPPCSQPATSLYQVTVANPYESHFGLDIDEDGQQDAKLNQLLSTLDQIYDVRQQAVQSIKTQLATDALLGIQLTECPSETRAALMPLTMANGKLEVTSSPMMIPAVGLGLTNMDHGTSQVPISIFTDVTAQAGVTWVTGDAVGFGLRKGLLEGEIPGLSGVMVMGLLEDALAAQHEPLAYLLTEELANNSEWALQSDDNDDGTITPDEVCSNVENESIEYYACSLLDFRPDVILENEEGNYWPGASTYTPTHASLRVVIEAQLIQ